MTDVREWNGHSGPVLDEHGGFSIVDCKGCRFKHSLPIPEPDHQNSYYADDFMEERPLYLDRYLEDLDWWRMVCEEKYEILEGLLPRNRRSLLDIGCGLGLFSQIGAERGWTPVGIEPARQSASYARSQGVEVINEPLSDSLVKRLETFDVIHMHEVLEHLSDPAETLRMVRSLRAPEGLLCVVVPNDYNPLQSLLRGRGVPPWWVVPPVHLNYFDFDSLGGLLERSGFRVERRLATFPMELFLLMGENYVGNDSLGRSCHGRRKALELLLRGSDRGALKTALYESFAEQGIGREILMVARRERDGD
jgi:SAM-dependent methyltransferase